MEYLEYHIANEISQLFFSQIMTNPFDPQPGHQYQINHQVQRHEIARLQQRIYEFELHANSLYQYVDYIGRTMKTQEDVLRHSQLLFELNQTLENLNKHRMLLAEMMKNANFDFGRNISDHSRREIYHFYHAGRYTQNELASQYGVSQSAVSKIVNGPAPPPLEGVNANGIIR